jgi:peptide/nickel transport system substrate-binding protein
METAPMLQDLAVRQAIAYAIDRADLIDKVARGAGIVANAGYTPVESIWYNPEVKSYDHDPEKAKELLDGKTYDLTLVIGSSNNEVRIAELIKLNLAEVGINLTVESFDTKTRDAMVKSGDYQLLITGHGGWGNDPDVLRDYYANGAIPGYNNQEINRLAAEQLLATDQEQRATLIDELQSAIAEDLPMLPLYNTKDESVYRPAKYDGWTYMFNHHQTTHAKISFLSVDTLE